jgi:uncharacterized lipoprotein YmbA
MMRKGYSLKITLLVMLAALMLVGCRSSASPVEFYTLNPISGMQKKTNTAAADQKLAIGVGPVEIPTILDRPQIVTRTGQNRLQMDEFHRWAGPLDENFARVVAENISILLPTDHVAVYPWDADFKPRYQIAMNVSYFEGRLGETIRLEVLWRVSDPKNQKKLIQKKSVIKEPLPTKDYEALVAAKSQALVTLSTEIVGHIRNLTISGKKE